MTSHAHEFFKRRYEAVYRKHCEQWWIWWKHRYSNDTEFWFDTPARKLAQFNTARAKESFYRRHKPPPSEHQQEIMCKHIVTLLGGPIRYWERNR